MSTLSSIVESMLYDKESLKNLTYKVTTPVKYKSVTLESDKLVHKVINEDKSIDFKTEIGELLALDISDVSKLVKSKVLTIQD